MITSKTIAVAAALVGLVGAGTAQAAYITSYGHTANGSRSVPLTAYEEALEARDAFFDGGMPAVQNFESYTAGAVGPLDITFAGNPDLDIPDVVATLTGAAGKVEQAAPGTAVEGRYSVGGDPANAGSKFWTSRATSTGESFELWFNKPIVKFGFFGVDVGDQGGVLELELLITDPVTGQVQVIGTVATGSAVSGTNAEGSVLYLGVTASNEAEWFTGVRFRSFAPGRGAVSDDIFAFDSFTVVAAPTGTGTTPLPAPGTLALLGAALTGLALLRRRA